MVKIRLQRTGKKNDPRYRVVVTDSRNPRDGKVLDVLGYLNPKREGDWKLDVEKYEWWVARGAQPTPRVKALLKLAHRQAQQTT